MWRITSLHMMCNYMSKLHVLVSWWKGGLFLLDTGVTTSHELWAMSWRAARGNSDCTRLPVAAFFLLFIRSWSWRYLEQNHVPTLLTSHVPRRWTVFGPIALIIATSLSRIRTLSRDQIREMNHVSLTCWCKVMSADWCTVRTHVERTRLPLEGFRSI